MSCELQSWPDLVGKDGNEAVEQIKKQTGFTDVQALPEDSIVTCDYRTDRVRVFLNGQGKVARAPTVG